MAGTVIIEALQIRVLGFGVDRAGGCQARLFVWRQLRFDLIRDGVGNFVLKLQNIAQATLIGLS